MDTVARVLGSPRGRHFVATLGFRHSADDRADRHWVPHTYADALEILAAVDPAVVVRLSEFELLDALSLTTNFARYWQPPEEEDQWFARPEALGALEPIARAALASPHAEWWATPVDLSRQMVVEKCYFGGDWSGTSWVDGQDHTELHKWREDAMANEARFLSYYDDDPSRQIGGEWWSTPLADGVPATSRSRPDIGAVGLALEEDDNSDGLRGRVRPTRVRGEPRAYEITGPHAWAQLVEAYPLAVPASRRSDWHDTTGEHHHWLMPDWAAVATAYDAVHLTVVGYLSTPGIAIPVADGASVLAGWDPDATFWLNPRLISVIDDPIEWRRTQESPWGPV